MNKKQKYKKIIKYNNFSNEFFGKKEKDRDISILCCGMICMIQIVGQVFWIIALLLKLSNRKSYYVIKGDSV